MAKRSREDDQFENDYTARPYQVSTDGEESYDYEPEDFGEPDGLSPQYPYYDDADEDEIDEADSEQRFHVAMGVFNFISVLAGVVVILMMVALLISLFTWLRSDMMDSFKLLTQGLS